VTARGYILVAAVVFAAGAWLGWAARGHGASAAVAQANKIDAPTTAALSKGVSSAKVAQAKDPAIQAAHSAVDADRTRLQADEVRRAAQPVQPASAGSTGPAAAPVASAVEQDQAQLITDLTAENGALRAQNADLKLAVTSLTQAGQGFQQESTGLRAAVTSARPWAVGLIYGTSQTMGAFMERDLGPIRAGVDVVRRVLPAGNATIDASARLGWRF
jgi:hypothetical protein